MHTVLLVDDDVQVLELNMKYLEKNGYKVQVAKNAIAALKIVQKSSPDCIVLDVMMPDMNGFAACRELRKYVDVPIIFLTGRTSEEDKIKGLILGADDYMVKPYSLKELTARILVNIRRYKASSASATTISYPPLSLDLSLHKAYFQEEEIPLSNREFQLLYYLVSRKNEPVTFQEIGEKVWGVYNDEDRRSIMVNVSRLRKKLEGYSGLENVIETVWSKGYKFSYR